MVVKAVVVPTGLTIAQMTWWETQRSLSVLTVELRLPWDLLPQRLEARFQHNLIF